MRFSVGKLLTVTTMVAVHCCLMTVGYPDLTSAVTTPPTYLALFAVALVAAALQSGRVRRNAGQVIVVASIPHAWVLPWIGLAVLDTDLVVAALGLDSAFRLGLVRHGLLACLITAATHRSDILIADNGVVTHGHLCLFRWDEITSRLRSHQGRWWLELDGTTYGRLLNTRFQVPNESLSVLRSTRARAALSKPTTAINTDTRLQNQRPGEETTDELE